MRLWRFGAAVVLGWTTMLCGQSITVATYNIENFNDRFEAHRLSQQATTRPVDDVAKHLITEERKHNDKDNWELAQVILDEHFSPDVLVIEECCDQSDLEYFNRHWLKGAYETVIVFPSNSDRGQSLGMMLKPGFKVAERKDQYYLEKDTVANERGERLFARGPAFCLVQAPGGYRCWVGVTHQKSKARDNGVAVTQWRNREAARTHQIMLELAKQGPADVVLLGDMNDSLGMDRYEKEAGADAIATLVGPAEDGVVLATQRLADRGEVSFHGYWKDNNRDLIDHILITRSVQPEVEDVEVFASPLARVASDHYPVFVRIRPRTEGNGDQAKATN